MLSDIISTIACWVTSTSIYACFSMHSLSSIKYGVNNDWRDFFIVRPRYTIARPCSTECVHL